MARSGAQEVLTKENFVEGVINKSIDSDNNTITNIDNSCVKSAAGIEISKLESVACSVSSGSYTGNDTANRAIPHGLGKTPKIIFFSIAGLARSIKILESGKLEYNYDLGSYSYGVTAANSTNFYVGNGVSYNRSCNGGPYTYSWVAIA